jgi:hypothetical protein
MPQSVHARAPRALRIVRPAAALGFAGVPGAVETDAAPVPRSPPYPAGYLAPQQYRAPDGQPLSDFGHRLLARLVDS